MRCHEAIARLASVALRCIPEISSVALHDGTYHRSIVFSYDHTARPFPRFEGVPRWCRRDPTYRTALEEVSSHAVLDDEVVDGNPGRVAFCSVFGEGSARCLSVHRRAWGTPTAPLAIPLVKAMLRSRALSLP